MKLLYYGLKNRHQFDEKRKEEIEKYINSTLLDAALNNTIQYIRDSAGELEASASPSNYKQKFDEFLYCVICKLECFRKVAEEIGAFYQNHPENRESFVWTLLNEEALGNRQKICRFLEKNGYRKWHEYNRDNPFTLENHVRIISRIEMDLMSIRDEFRDMPYTAQKQKKLNDRITITVKSSAKKYCMALLHCVKQVRQIRWLAWFENYLYLLLFASTATIS